MLWFNLFSPELREDKPPCALITVIGRSFIKAAVFWKLQARLGIKGRTVHVEPRKETLGLTRRCLELRAADLTGVDAIERKQDV